MVALTRKNLLGDIPRFLVAQAEIMPAVSLVTIQTGIFNGFIRSTAKLIDNSNADECHSRQRVIAALLNQLE